MKRLVAFVLVGFVLSTVSGCGSKAENSIKDMISQMNDMSAALEKKESPDKIKAIGEKMKNTAQQLKDLKLPKEEEEKLQKKYEADMKAALERLMKAAIAN